ncbi:hypothetical protein [Lactococcus lactis]|uniref:hypothetical protein n=1 Tax=Lactococcus lactis TaxID=1358 RepID=UPI0012AB1C76|nr:hypothetical protein [Lactococcus lactis]
MIESILNLFKIQKINFERFSLLALVLFVSTFFISYQPIFEYFNFKITISSLSPYLSIVGGLVGLLFLLAGISDFFSTKHWSKNNYFASMLMNLFLKVETISSSLLFLTPLITDSSPQKLFQIVFVPHSIDVGLVLMVFFSLLRLFVFSSQVVGFDFRD